MGEVAELRLCGILCEHCGTYIGEEIGHPRLCEDCSEMDKEDDN